MILLNMLLTILILCVHVAGLALFFLAIMHLDIKMKDNKHREALMILALFIYLLVMVVLSKLLREGFTIIWG